MIQSVEVELGPANGPHYSKTQQVVVLTGCADGTPNCALAKPRASSAWKWWRSTAWA